MRLAELFVAIRGDDAPLNHTLAGVRTSLLGLTRSGVGAGAGLGRGLGSGLAAGLGANVNGLLFGVAAGGLAAGAGLRKAARDGSDLAESLSKVEVVFGKSAGVIKDTADGMAKSFGLPKREILDAAAGIGLVGKGAGQTQAQAAALGSEMARLAADASSFYNVSLDQSLEKIRAGLVGESEPLRAFGVMLSEDAVKAEALRLGLAKSNKELTDANKVAARASLIRKGLGDATGDLERTQSGAANQSRQFQGQLENLSATVGTALLPAFNEMLGLANRVAGDMAEGFEKNEGTFASFVGAVKTGVADAGAVYDNFGNVVKFVGVDIAENVAMVETEFTRFTTSFSALVDHVTANAPRIGQALAKSLSYLSFNPVMFLNDSAQSLVGSITGLMNGGEVDPKMFARALRGGGGDDIAAVMSEFKAPAIPEVDHDLYNQMRDDIRAEMNERAAEANKPKPKAAPAGGKAKDEGGAPAKPEKEKKAEFRDLVEFTKQFQIGVFGKDDATKKTAQFAEMTAKGINQLVQLARNPKPVVGVAGGPG